MSQRILTKIVNMIKYAFVSKTMVDNQRIPTLQVTYFGKSADAQNITPYGFYNSPPLNSLAWVFSNMGDESKLGAISDDVDNRLKGLKEGEVAISNTKSGAFIKLLQDGTIEIKSDTINIAVSGNAEISGDAIEIKGGNITLSGSVALGGSGGLPVARSGDSVLVDTSTGIGTVTSGSSNVSSI